MSEEEINIAIAEYCGCTWYAVEKAGWYYRQGGHGYTNRIEEAGKYSKEDAQKEIVRGEPMSIVKIPHSDYCNDLNEMHEIEKMLDDDQWLEYMLNLQDVLQRDPYRGKWIVCLENMHSTAVQRAKAFVKTIGKWKE